MDEFQMLMQMAGGDPEKARALVESGLFAEQMGQAGRDYRTGGAMFATPSAEGMRVGGTYKAASPVEHLANAMTRAIGLGQMRNARNAENKAMGGVTDFRLAAIKAMQPQTYDGPSIQSPQPIGGGDWMGVPYPYPR